MTKTSQIPMEILHQVTKWMAHQPQTTTRQEICEKTDNEMTSDTMTTSLLEPTTRPCQPLNKTYCFQPNQPKTKTSQRSPRTILTCSQKTMMTCLQKIRFPMASQLPQMISLKQFQFRKPKNSISV